MANEAYTLIDVDFSSSDKTVVLESEEVDGKVIVIRSKVVTSLNAGVLYKVPGWEDQGHCNAEICEICEVEKDRDGLITSFTGESIPSSSTVLNKIDVEVRKRITSNNLTDHERSFITQFLETMNESPDYPHDGNASESDPFIYP